MNLFCSFSMRMCGLSPSEWIIDSYCVVFKMPLSWCLVRECRLGRSSLPLSLHNPETSPHPTFCPRSMSSSTPSCTLHRVSLFLLTSYSSLISPSTLPCPSVPLWSPPPPPLPLPQSNGSMYLLAHCRWLGRRFEPKDERADPVMRILMPRNCLALTHTRAQTDSHSQALKKWILQCYSAHSSAACLMRAILKFCCRMKVELKWLCNFKVSLSLVADGLHAYVQSTELAFLQK